MNYHSFENAEPIPEDGVQLHCIALDPASSFKSRAKPLPSNFQGWKDIPHAHTMLAIERSVRDLGFLYAFPELPIKISEFLPGCHPCCEAVAEIPLDMWADLTLDNSSELYDLMSADICLLEEHECCELMIQLRDVANPVNDLTNLDLQNSVDISALCVCLEQSDNCCIRFLRKFTLFFIVVVLLGSFPIGLTCGIIGDSTYRVFAYITFFLDYLMICLLRFPPLCYIFITFVRHIFVWFFYAHLVGENVLSAFTNGNHTEICPVYALWQILLLLVYSMLIGFVCCDQINMCKSNAGTRNCKRLVYQIKSGLNRGLNRPTPHGTWRSLPSIAKGIMSGSGFDNIDRRLVEY